MWKAVGMTKNMSINHSFHFSGIEIQIQTDFLKMMFKLFHVKLALVSRREVGCSIKKLEVDCERKQFDSYFEKLSKKNSIVVCKRLNNCKKLNLS